MIVYMIGSDKCRFCRESFKLSR